MTGLVDRPVELVHSDAGSEQIIDRLPSPNPRLHTQFVIAGEFVDRIMVDFSCLTMQAAYSNVH
jgi:hypothetical protein